MAFPHLPLEAVCGLISSQARTESRPKVNKHERIEAFPHFDRHVRPRPRVRYGATLPGPGGN